MTSSMSNSKWKRLFEAIEEEEIALPVCEWRFLRDDRWFRQATPRVRDLTDEGLPDSSALGPFLFKDVECLRWPRSYEVSPGRGSDPWHKEQDLEAVAKLLCQIGEFDFEMRDETLTIFGFR